MIKKEKVDEDIQAALKDIVTQCEKEDEFVRRAQIKTWKKHEEFWSGTQYLFWNDKAQTWISPTSGASPNLGFSEEEMEQLGPFYDFVIDIFSAHGQSIISALSAQLPAIKFLPDDGNDDEDIDTAKTYDKIAELVARHNNAKLKFIQTLFYAYINGFFASYRYIDTDKNYGVYSVPVFEDQEVEIKTCPECGGELNGIRMASGVTGDLGTENDGDKKDSEKDKEVLGGGKTKKGVSG